MRNDDAAMEDAEFARTIMEVTFLMRIVTNKKEQKVQKIVSEITVLADSLYFWIESLNRRELLKDDTFLSEVLNRDIRELKEKANRLFWDEL